MENFNSNIKATKPNKKQGEKMTPEELKICAKKRTWLDFVKRILSATKLFDDEKLKTKMLCIEVDYLKLCDLVANKIYSSVFCQKKYLSKLKKARILSLILR